MADFCSLCGYNDINITELYNKHIKPELLEDIDDLKDTQYISVNVGGVCEHCGIVSFGVNNKLEVWGGYYEGNSHKFGNIDKNTLDLILIDNDIKYVKKNEEVAYEVAFMKFGQSIIEFYCFIKQIDKLDLKEEDLQNIDEIYKSSIKKLFLIK